MSNQSFIETIAKYARNEYLSRKKWVLPSICIAQAALESGWNLNAKTLFGIKGKGVTTRTKEYVNGQYIDTIGSFQKYDNVQAAVKGYYDLLTTKSRYSNIVNNSNYMSVAYNLKADGYATDPSYSEKIIRIVESNNLHKYDDRTVAPKGTGLTLDGIMGVATTKATQKYFKTTQDGVISGQYKSNIARCPGITTMKQGRKGSTMIKALQKYLGVTQDGHLGPNTIKAWQKKMGTIQDGTISKPSNLIKAWQKYLNGVM